MAHRLAPALRPLISELPPNSRNRAPPTACRVRRVRDRQPLTEGYVEAFGVDPQLRRQGIGTALQQHAARQCRIAGCYQMRSRSPVTSAENYAPKIAAGYVLHPSHENDSYYFLLRL
ncbi:MAG: GNAT family N-acetyltransferase [Actinobacteria bacterium]|nr:GNAT family N-acetyltransferase [Actinomycetota bacterium]